MLIRRTLLPAIAATVLALAPAGTAAATTPSQLDLPDPLDTAPLGLPRVHGRCARRAPVGPDRSADRVRPRQLHRDLHRPAAPADLPAGRCLGGITLRDRAHGGVRCCHRAPLLLLEPQ